MNRNLRICMYLKNWPKYAKIFAFKPMKSYLMIRIDF